MVSTKTVNICTKSETISYSMTYPRALGAILKKDVASFITIKAAE